MRVPVHPGQPVILCPGTKKYSKLVVSTLKSASLEIKTGGKKTADSAKRALTYALTVFFSFCATGAKVLSALSPFGLAAMAALPSNLSFLAFFGSMAGCLVFGGITVLSDRAFGDAGAQISAVVFSKA